MTYISRFCPFRPLLLAQIPCQKCTPQTNIELPSINTILVYTSQASSTDERRRSSPESAASRNSPEDSAPPPPAVAGDAPLMDTPGSAAAASKALPLHPADGSPAGDGARISSKPPLPPPDQSVDEAKFRSSAKSAYPTGTTSTSGWKRPGSTLENGALVIGGEGASGEFRLERPRAHLGRWPCLPPEAEQPPDASTPAIGVNKVEDVKVVGGENLMVKAGAPQLGDFQPERPPAHLGRWPEVIPEAPTDCVCERRKSGEVEGRVGSSDRTVPPSLPHSGMSSAHAGGAGHAGRGVQSPLAFAPPSRPWAAGNSHNCGHRNKPAFGFESEDDTSTVDLGEQKEGGGGGDSSKALNSAGSSVGSGWGGSRNQSKNTVAASFSMAGGWSTSVMQAYPRAGRRGIENPSPDGERLLTPRSPSTPSARPLSSVGSASPAASESSTLSGRPLSTEKQQFLVKVGLDFVVGVLCDEHAEQTTGCLPVLHAVGDTLNTAHCQK